MEQEEINGIGLEDLDDFGVGEKSGAIYYKGERLCTTKELTEVRQEIEKLKAQIEGRADRTVEPHRYPSFPGDGHQRKPVTRQP